MNEEMLTTRWRFHFWEEREEDTKLRISLFSRLASPPLYYICKEKSRDTK
jgi:hypothetical protein